MADLPQLLMSLPSLEPMPVALGEPERATPDDAVGIAALLSVAFEEHWDAQRAMHELGPSNGVEASYVVREDNKVVAVASARRKPEVFPDSGYVHYVAADAAYRGRGLGATVTVAVLRHFAAAGLSTAVLETDDFRLPAIRTYLKLGFVPEYRHDQDKRRWSTILPLVLTPAQALTRSTHV